MLHPSAPERGCTLGTVKCDGPVPRGEDQEHPATGKVLQWVSGENAVCTEPAGGPRRVPSSRRLVRE